jgi:hypothetical protein
MTKVYTVNWHLEQMKALSASGYHTINLEQLHDYLVYDDNFKPIVISFDELGASKYSLVLLKCKNTVLKLCFFV